MATLLALTVGVLFAAGVYMVLRRSLVKVLIGLAILTNAANLLIFSSAGLTRGRPPLVPLGADTPGGAVADPLPQALVLTAIVIGFGVQAFAVVLVYRAYRDRGTDDSDRMASVDRVDFEEDQAI